MSNIAFIFHDQGGSDVDDLAGIIASCCSQAYESIYLVSGPGSEIDEKISEQIVKSHLSAAKTYIESKALIYPKVFFIQASNIDKFDLKGDMENSYSIILTSPFEGQIKKVTALERFIYKFKDLSSVRITMQGSEFQQSRNWCPSFGRIKAWALENKIPFIEVDSNLCALPIQKQLYPKLIEISPGIEEILFKNTLNQAIFRASPSATFAMLGLIYGGREANWNAVSRLYLCLEGACLTMAQTAGANLENFFKRAKEYVTHCRSNPIYLENPELDAKVEASYEVIIDRLVLMQFALHKCLGVDKLCIGSPPENILNDLKVEFVEKFKVAVRLDPTIIPPFYDLVANVVHLLYLYNDKKTIEALLPKIKDEKSFFSQDQQDLLGTTITNILCGKKPVLENRALLTFSTVLPQKCKGQESNHKVTQ